MNDPATIVDYLVRKATRLYSLPAVAMEVLQLTDNPQLDTRAMKECIENDPALTSKILRVVNSSLFGLSREISDLNQALALLGTKPLKLLVLGFSLPGGLFAEIEARTAGRYWRHTLTKAVACREISERLWHIPGDDAFIAGLLQDLGELLLLQELGEAYAQFLDRVSESGLDLDIFETESLGFTHATLSARLLAQWHLPENLVEAVAADPRQLSSAATASRTALPRILHLAELVAQLLAEGQTAILRPLLEYGRDYRNLGKEQWIPLLGDLEEKVRQLAAVLTLQLPEGVQYVDVLAEAQRQLAGVASQTVEDMFHGSPRPEAALPPEDCLFEEIQGLADALAAACRPAFRTEQAHADLPAMTGLQVSKARTVATVAAASAPAQVIGAAADAGPGLMGSLCAAVTACRQSHCPLSLLLVELDGADELLLLLGGDGFDALRRLLRSACTRLGRCYACSSHGEAGFAVILPNCERRLAIQMGDQLLQALHQVKVSRKADVQPPISLSVGVATLVLPPKNFLPQELLSAADHCRYASHACGGGVVKSIEI